MTQVYAAPRASLGCPRLCCEGSMKLRGSQGQLGESRLHLARTRRALRDSKRSQPDSHRQVDRYKSTALKSQEQLAIKAARKSAPASGGIQKPHQYSTSPPVWYGPRTVAIREIR